MADRGAVRVTVAVCTWNRALRLREMLECCTALRTGAFSWELLVVDNQSTDETPAVVAAYTGRLPIRSIRESRPGLSHARNAAVAAAAGEYILFTDDDVLVDPEWLVSFDEATRRHPEADVFGGVIEPWFPETPDPDLLAVFPQLRSGFCGLDHARPAGPLPPPLPLFGANLGFRRRALEGLAFDPSLGVRPNVVMGGEELAVIEAIRARGGAVIWWPAMRVCHVVQPSRMTEAYLLAHEAGIGAAQTRLTPDVSAARLLGVPRWLWRRRAEAALRTWAAVVGGDGAAAWPWLSGAPPAPSASSRVRQLTWQRERARLRGMARGYEQ